MKGLLGLSVARPLRRSGGAGCQHDARHRRAGAPERRRAPRADDPRGEGRPAHQSRAAIIPGGRKPEERCARGAGSVLWVNDTKRFNELQKHRGRGVAAQDPRALRARRDPRLPDDLPAARWAWRPRGTRRSHERAQAVAAQGGARRRGSTGRSRPMVDIARDARWGRIVEGAGEDPYLGSAMAAAQVRGFQGPYLGAPDRVRRLRQALRRLRRRRGRARLRSRLRLRDGCSATSTSLRSRRRAKAGVGSLHERLHGPERRAGRRQPLAAARRPARRVGLPAGSW